MARSSLKASHTNRSLSPNSCRGIQHMPRFKSRSPLRLSTCSISSYNTENCVAQSQEFSNSPKFAQDLRFEGNVLQDSKDMNKQNETFFTTKGNEMEGSFRDSAIHSSHFYSENASQLSLPGNKENNVKYRSKTKKRRHDRLKESFISNQTAQTA